MKNNLFEANELFFIPKLLNFAMINNKLKQYVKIIICNIWQNNKNQGLI